MLLLFTRKERESHGQQGAQAQGILEIEQHGEPWESHNGLSKNMEVRRIEYSPKRDSLWALYSANCEDETKSRPERGEEDGRTGDRPWRHQFTLQWVERGFARVS